jgi:hypothetical protein
MQVLFRINPKFSVQHKRLSLLLSDFGKSDRTALPHDTKFPENHPARIRKYAAFPHFLPMRLKNTGEKNIIKMYKSINRSARWIRERRFAR